MASGDEGAAAGLRRLLDTGGAGARVGWKIGLNVAAVQERLGIDRPVVGRLTADRVIEAGGAYPVAGARALHAEPEVALVLGADVAAGAGAGAARAAISAFAPALELVDLAGAADATDVEEIVAGNVFHRAVAFGTPSPEQPGGRAVLRVGGEERAGADLADAFPDPAETVLVVADRLAAAGAALRAGDRIIAGSLTPPQAVAAGDRLELELDGLGPLSLALAP